jgi:RNA polymerase sigma factor (sigma-70 family)
MTGISEIFREQFLRNLESLQEDQPDIPAQIEDEVRAILKRLRFDAEHFNGIFPIPYISQQVIEELPGITVKIGDLAYRVIGRKLWEACRTEGEDREAGYQALGEYLYRNIYPKVYGDSHLAEDLTNQSLEIVFRKIDSCHSPHLFLSWAARIAVNEILQLKRKESFIAPSKSPDNLTDEESEDNEFRKTEEISRKVMRIISIEQEESRINGIPAGRQANPETVYLGKEQMHQLVDWIKNIKETRRGRLYRSILFQTYFKGLEDTEIADILNRSVEDIRRMRSHILQKIRQELQFFDDED